jgi:hypothetical protein
MGARWWLAIGAAMLIACGGSSASKQPSSTTEQQPPPPPPPPPPPAPPQGPKPPVVSGDYAFYGTDQGLTDTIYDVSADEGGNVYVAGGAAVFARALADQDFKRFDATTSGLTKNCHDPSQIANASPPDAASMCPVISVAGASAGKAIIGFKGVGTDGDLDADWAIDSGGADVVTFDGASLTRARHVFIASPPHSACEHWANPPTNSICAETYIGSIWDIGRRKLRQVNRIVVNHDKSRPLSYGDAYMGGTHASLTILAANPEARGWIDYIAQSGSTDPKWKDSIGVWEHHHPAIDSPTGAFLTGSAYAIGVDPVNGAPWYANEFRMASLQGYATMSHPTWNMWWGDQVPDLPHLWIWQQEASQTDASLRDNVSSISFCADGTMWLGSDNHGLARISLDRSRLGDTTNGYGIQRIPTPDGTGGAMAVACDTDGLVWVGFSWGGFGRLADGAWTNMSFQLQNAGVPRFTLNPVRSIQIDRWSTPRRVYLAHLPSVQDGPGGVTVYSGR